MKAEIAICLIAFICVANARLGIDLPTPNVLTVEQAKCLVQNNYDMLFIRAFRSYGTVDPNVLINIENAIKAGVNYIDVYIFPCVPCGNPRKQVQDTIQNLGKAPYGIIWVDVEEFAWKADKEYNRQFISEMLNELDNLDKKAGVYASLYQWDKIVGKDWDGAKKYLLWYPHWDHKPSFDGFKPFGGWIKPYAKQYESEGKICGMTGLDLDYMP